VAASDRWIRINLFEQTLAAYDGGRLVFDTLVASGLPSWYTRPGVFQVYKKVDTQPMSGAFAADRSDYYYLEDVPWVLYFDRARALHGTYWHDGFGYPRSHGCVNLSIGDAHWLYEWAGIGTWVQVYDPSGKTPTDPSFYSNDAGAP
jgi:lipoprotein-anchoring transpeptidase ErfK/SrfK